MKSGIGLFLVCLVLAAIVSFTCIRIELLNAQAGGILPREIRGGGNPKWRVAAQKALQKSVERRVIRDRIGPGDDEQWAGYFDDQGNVRPGVVFTEAEQKSIAAEMELARINADLRSWVAGMGLLQYLVGPLLLILSLVLLLKSRRTAVRISGALFATIACGAMICMLYRGYFTSLGW